MPKAPRLEVYKAGDGWRWRCVAGNERIIGQSDEAHRSKRYARRKAKRQFPDGVFD